MSIFGLFSGWRRKKPLLEQLKEWPRLKQLLAKLVASFHAKQLATGNMLIQIISDELFAVNDAQRVASSIHSPNEQVRKELGLIVNSLKRLREILDRQMNAVEYNEMGTYSRALNEEREELTLEEEVFQHLQEEDAYSSTRRKFDNVAEPYGTFYSDNIEFVHRFAVQHELYSAFVLKYALPVVFDAGVPQTPENIIEYGNVLAELTSIIPLHRVPRTLTGGFPIIFQSGLEPSLQNLRLLVSIAKGCDERHVPKIIADNLPRFLRGVDPSQQTLEFLLELSKKTGPMYFQEALSELTELFEQHELPSRNLEVFVRLAGTTEDFRVPDIFFAVNEVLRLGLRPITQNFRTLVRIAQAAKDKAPFVIENGLKAVFKTVPPTDENLAAVARVVERCPSDYVLVLLSKDLPLDLVGRENVSPADIELQAHELVQKH